METYLGVLPKNVIIIVVSKLRSVDDVTIMSDMFNLNNMDYRKLCEMYHPKLFPVKFIYGDTFERYSWTNLYLNFLKEGMYNCDIISFVDSDKIFDKNRYICLSINPDVVVFLVLIGRIPLRKIRKFIEKILGVDPFDECSYSTWNYITHVIIPVVFTKMFENKRYLHIEGAKDVMSRLDELTPDDVDIPYVRFIWKSSRYLSKGYVSDATGMSLDIITKFGELKNE